MNAGKIFERQWRKSAEKDTDLFYYRFQDSPAAWGGDNSTLRFTNDNICDVMMFKSPILFLLEFKTENTKSISHKRLRKNQLDGLLEANNYQNICAGVVIYFSKLDECYFLDIKDFDNHMKTSGRKSIPISYCQENGVKIDVIPLRVNRMYNVNKFVEQIKCKV